MELFLNENLPKPLKSSVLLEYLEKVKNGDKDARDIVILHNIKLVINQVIKKFFTVQYDQKELVSVGIIGLMKAVDTYDVSKSASFPTYAVTCINNEILMFLRNLKKTEKDESIHEAVAHDKSGNELTYADLVLDENINIVEDYEKQMILKEIRNQVKILKPRERKAIELYFGFCNDKEHSQEEIGKIIGVTRSYVSKIILISLKKIQREMYNNGFFDKLSAISMKKTNSKNKRKRYEENEEALRKFQGERKTIIKENSGFVNEKKEEVFSSEMEFNILDYFKHSILKKMISLLSSKEIFIICLKFGFINERVFTNNEIAKFLNINEEEVISIIKNVLILYKKNINDLLDDVTLLLTEDETVKGRGLKL